VIILPRTYCLYYNRILFAETSFLLLEPPLRILFDRRVLSLDVCVNDLHIYIPNPSLRIKASFFSPDLANQFVNVLNKILRNEIRSAVASQETCTESAVMIYVAYRTSYSISCIGANNTRLQLWLSTSLRGEHAHLFIHYSFGKWLSVVLRTVLL
jgi:hypothetical protein